MSRVLESLGGVAADDIVFVSDATRTAFLGAFDRLGRLVARASAPASAARWSSTTPDTPTRTGC